MAGLVKHLKSDVDAELKAKLNPATILKVMTDVLGGAIGVAGGHWGSRFFASRFW